MPYIRLILCINPLSNAPSVKFSNVFGEITIAPYSSNLVNEQAHIWSGIDPIFLLPPPPLNNLPFFHTLFYLPPPYPLYLPTYLLIPILSIY